jgi:hypothetical protein
MFSKGSAVEIRKIIERLADFSPTTLVEVPNTVYIQTHKMIKPNQSQYYSACLYVGYASDLPDALTGGQQSNLICIDDAPIPEKVLINKMLNLYRVPNGINQFDVLNKVADIMIDEAAVTAAMRQILDALYANVGIQGLVNVASELFENPIFINDTAYKLLAMTDNAVFEDSALEEEKQSGYLNKQVFADLRTDKIFEKSRRSGEIVHSKRSNSDQHWLFKSVYIRNIVVADIAIVDLKRPFSHVDYELLERFASVIGMEMEKDNLYAANKGIMYNYFLADLISGSINQPGRTYMYKQTIDQRASMLGLKLHEWFKLCVIVEDKGGDLSNQYPYITRQLHELIPDCIWSVYRGNLVVFVSRSDRCVLTESDFSKLYDFCADNNLIIGSSNSFSDLTKANQFYKQSLHSAEVGLVVGGETRVFEYEKFLMFYAFQILLKRNRFEEFVHPAVFELDAYDKNNESDFLRTLEVWLDCACNSSAAAKMLIVHRNTLLYRLARIEELTSLDFKDGNDLLICHFSIKMLNYQRGLS